MSVRNRRTHNIVQGKGVRAAAQLSYSPQATFVRQNPQDQVDWSVNSLIAPDLENSTPFHALEVHQQPPQLSLTVPTELAFPTTQQDFLVQPTSNNLASPSSDILSPDVEMSMAALPTYKFDDGQPCDPNYDDWKPLVISDDNMNPIPVFDPFEHSTPQYSIPAPVTETVDPHHLAGDASQQLPSYAISQPGPKQRSAHRKAIEEKSSIKRKNAEHRLCNAITRRLEGTFVPGLANQLNQAADLLERDHTRISELEKQNSELLARLRATDRDIKRPTPY